MSGTWGRSIRLTIFGESHGPAVGMVLDGLPPGFPVDWADVSREMARRAPGSGELSTRRAETDSYEILSGMFEGKTTGAPLTALIRNEDARSSDYSPHILRPGHADWTALVKYKGHADHRGGGRFSGRLTAPLVCAGAIAKQVLRRDGIDVGARIVRIYDAEDTSLDTCGAAIWHGEAAARVIAASKKTFPAADDAAGERMKAAILRAKQEGDSVGGVIECAATGLPAGWGEPFFGSVESSVASMMFSIPAVKGIEFGAGFGFARLRGSEANDPLEYDEGGLRVRAATNRNGGVNGGISNGHAVIFRVAVKPTPTIGKEQRTVDIASGETVLAAFGGRHDPCIAPRAVPAIEAGLALCLLDLSASGNTASA